MIVNTCPLCNEKPVQRGAAHGKDKCIYLGCIKCNTCSEEFFYKNATELTAAKIKSLASWNKRTTVKT